MLLKYKDTINNRLKNKKYFAKIKFCFTFALLFAGNKI